jgi:hypothetical protein
MGEDRVNALILLYVHKDIEIDISKVVEMYARQCKSSLKKVNKSLTTSLFAKWRWAGINAFCDKLLNLML